MRVVVVPTMTGSLYPQKSPGRARVGASPPGHMSEAGNVSVKLPKTNSEDGKSTRDGFFEGRLSLPLGRREIGTT